MTVHPTPTGTTTEGTTCTSPEVMMSGTPDAMATGH